MIDRLVAGRRQPDGVTVGPGDDAAVVAMPDGRVVVTTDMLVEGRHFRLDWSAPHDVGRKAIAQNAADVESMGARTTAFVVAFGAPQDTPVARVQELADGMWLEAGQFGAGIVGGDLVASPQWVISVTALGDLAGRSPVLRSGARPGSVVAVAGELGRSAAGYLLWHNGIDDFHDIRQRHLVPRPPYGQGDRRRAGRRAGDDGRLRRPARRPRPHRDGVERDHRPVRGGIAGRRRRGRRPRPPRPVPTRGRWCSPAARITRWRHVSRAGAGRLAGDRRGAGRPAAASWWTAGSGPARRVGSPSTEPAEVGCRA